MKTRPTITKTLLSHAVVKVIKKMWSYSINKGAKPVRLALLLGLCGGVILSHIAIYGFGYYSDQVQACVSRYWQVDADEDEFY